MHFYFLTYVKRKPDRQKQKNPYFKGLIDGILVFSSLAEEGFEPPTFGL